MNKLLYWEVYKIKISVKGRYGLRAMVDLAINLNYDPVTLKSIAERQNISENYLEQVFAILRKAGLVKSIKGPQGGYILGDHPSKLIVGNILRVLEGDLSVIGKKNHKDFKTNSIEYCLETQIWNKIDESIAAVVDSITLDDLVNEYKKINNNSCFMYYI